jgi:hypothetical protein
MTPQEFQQYWKEEYPKSLPIGYHLRNAYRNRWFRIHTLPESQRYPATEAEYEEILRRHNTMLSDLLGEGQRFVLITTGYSSTPGAVRPYPHLQALDSESRELFSIPKHELEGETDPYYWHFFMSERTWRKNHADGLLKLIAENEIANVIFVGVDQRRVYHPYDGGADVIVESESMRDQKMEKYYAWLPENDSGL